jgi:hypothetical protein
LFIRFSQLAELPILLRQPPLHIRNNRFNPDDLDVRVLQNEFPNPSPELNELELLCQCLKIDWFPDPDFCCHPSIATIKLENSFPKHVSGLGGEGSGGFDSREIVPMSRRKIASRPATFGRQRCSPPWSSFCAQFRNALKFLVITLTAPSEFQGTPENHQRSQGFTSMWNVE